MKRLLAAIAIILMTGCNIENAPSTPSATPAVKQDRMERMAVQKVTNGTGVVAFFEAWHDKESGVEFICARGDETGGVQGNYSLSCVPTGRYWR